MHLDILLKILSILPLQFKFSSKVKPRKLNCKALSIVVLSINRYSGFTCFTLVWNIMYLLLFPFGDNLFTFSHSLTFTNSVLSVLSAVCFWVFFTTMSRVGDNVVSSAYIKKSNSSLAYKIYLC